MTYRLFAWPTSYAMGVHALLADLEVEHEVRWVKILTEDLDPDFARISPHGRVPVLQTPDGPVFEAGAIAHYLGERHAGGSLVIPRQDRQRGLFLQWMSYLGTTLQPDVMIQFHPELYFEDAETRERFKTASMSRLKKVLSVIDEALGSGPYFFGERRTVVDYVFALQAVWPEIYPDSIHAYPAIRRQVDTMLARPSVREVHDMHMALSQTIDRSGMRH